MWFNNSINRRNENMNGYENIDRSIVFCHTEGRKKKGRRMDIRNFIFRGR